MDGFSDDSLSFYFDYQDVAGGVYIIGVPAPDGSLKSLTVPDRLDGKPVLGIADASDARGVFSGLTGLERVEIPTTIRYIGSRAFCGLPNLSAVYFKADDDSNYDGLPHNAGLCVGERAFSDCPRLSFLNLPGECVEIGSGAFSRCTSLKDFLLPEKLCRLGDDAFAYCESMETLILPDALETIPVGAFAHCVNLRQVMFPINLQEILTSAFQSCGSLVRLRLPDSVSTIEEDAFADCVGLTEATRPSSLTRFGSAFRGCRNLSSKTRREFGISDEDPSVLLVGSVCEVPHIASTVNVAESSLESPAVPAASSSSSAASDVPVAAHGASAAEASSSAVSAGASDSASVAGAFHAVWRAIQGTPARLKLLVGILAGLLVVAACVLSSRTESFDGIEWKRSGKEIIIIGASSAEDTLVVPDTIKGRPVTGVYKYAFAGGVFKKVELPATVRVIGEGAFSDCAYLVAVTTPASLEELGPKAFAGCVSLTEAVLSDKIGTLDKNTFSGCENLRRVKLGNGLKRIGTGAFNGCAKLVDLIVPEGATTIEADAFSGCSKLETLSLPASVTTISGDVPTKEVTIAADEGSAAASWARNAGASVVPAFASRVEWTTVPGRNEIAISGFRADATTPGTKLVIPAHIDGLPTTWISDARVPVAPGVASAGDTTGFYQCLSLEEIVLPPTITSIGSHAFEACENLTSVVFTARPEGASLKLGASAFKGCRNLTSIEIPDGVETIEPNCFAGCEKLSQVRFPSTLRAVGKGAFERCRNLAALELPDSADKLGESAFAECSSLTSVVLPARLEEIDAKLFYFCESLAEVVVPGSVRSIGDFAFRGCRKLEKIELPKGLKRVGQQSFSECSLDYVVLSERLALLGTDAFDTTTRLIVPSAGCIAGQWAEKNHYIWQLASEFESQPGDASAPASEEE